ncbi:MAG: UDP-N-acetylenolpyruvoylglucosamine reductase [Bellilinea sp.]|nr:MAG: UDP-N-acetylenolpyruvoylglucosamine reductase [Bellilinea sp.]
MKSPLSNLPINELREQFGERLQENVRLANYTAARVGGPADALLVVNSADELEKAVKTLWEWNVPFLILGGGANVLVSDRGYHGVVLLNRAHTIKIHAQSEPPTVWAESGANLGMIARQAALRGLSGLEWANTVPGTLGGAIYGNAGAFGGDMQGNLLMAEILHPQEGKQTWPAEKFGYEYRSSVLKRSGTKAVILSATLKLERSTPQAVKEKMDEFSIRRKQTQPPGASLGSMFKNPPGDYAGRLIEAAGLKGMRVGGVQVSPVHANFFINTESATASDYRQLIEKVRKTVEEKFGVQLELEVELVGEWQDDDTNLKGE